MSDMLLVDGDTIPLNPKLASALGVNHALIFQQLHFLLTITRKSDKSYNFVDGYWWVYNSYEQWKSEHFPWMGRNAIINVFDDLEKRGLVISRKGVKRATDRRKWYRIDYKSFRDFKLSIVPNPNDPIVPNPNDVYTESTSKSTKKTKRADNPHFDTLVQLFGLVYESMTKSEKSLYGMTANELKTAGYTPDEIRLIHRYCVEQNFKNFTPRALAAHAGNWRRTQPKVAQQPQPPTVDMRDLIGGGS